jgi:hypothetical protein
MGLANGVRRVVGSRPSELAARHDQNRADVTADTQRGTPEHMRPFEPNIVEESREVAASPYVCFQRHPARVTARPIKGARGVAVRGRQGRDGKNGIRWRYRARPARTNSNGEDHDYDSCDELSHPYLNLAQPRSWLNVAPRKSPDGRLGTSLRASISRAHARLRPPLAASGRR